MSEPQLNLEEKVNPIPNPIRTDPSILTPIEPMSINRLSFSSIEINKSLPALAHSVSYR